MVEINEVRVVGKDLPISTKESIEICNFIRRRTLEDSKKILEGVIDEKRVIPYKRFNMDRAEKEGKIGPARYPKKASLRTLKVLESAEANAKNLHLDVKNLYMRSIIVNKASTSWPNGRQRRTKTKRTHVNVILIEKKDKEKFVLNLPVQKKRSKGGR